MRIARAPRARAVGLEPGAVRLVPHHPHWPRLAAALGRALRRALGARIKRIAHVGSTAVPGLPGKPVVDMQIELASLAAGRALVPRLGALGFELRDDDAIPGRLYFVRNAAGRRTMQLHVCAAGAGQANDRIAFRDRLRGDPGLLGRYLRLKRALMQRHRHDRIAYAMAKGGFVAAALRGRPARPRKPTPAQARAAWRELLEAQRSPRRPRPARTEPPGFVPRAARVWFFDLDNTLHDASHAIFAAIDTRMTDYVERHLALPREQANALRQTYWRRYGATLLGLMQHHAVDPHHFLRETHDFDVPALLRAERGLARLFARLPGRKVLLTNAPDAYAQQVLRGIALERGIERRYAIEAMRVHGRMRPKPSRALLRHLLARERVPAGRAVLVEDSAENLRAARAVGYRTVLITGHSPRRRAGRPGWLDLRLRSVRGLPGARLR